MHIFQKIFDFIFPPSKEESYVRSFTEEDIKRVFCPNIVEGVCVLSSYKNPKMRALIHEAKFHNNRRAWLLLNLLIQIYIESHESKVDVVIPVPLSKKRLRERGHNQVLSILTEKHLLDIHIEKNILKRNRHTKPQTKLPRKERLGNVRGAFVVKKSNKINNKHILLVDDVMTTGATMNAAKAALLQHSPSSVTCIALAH